MTTINKSEGETLKKISRYPGNSWFVVTTRTYYGPFRDKASAVKAASLAGYDTSSLN